MAKKTEVAVGKIIPVKVLEEDVDLLSLASQIGSEKKVKTKVRLRMKNKSKINKNINLKSKISLEVELS